MGDAPTLLLSLTLPLPLQCSVQTVVLKKRARIKAAAANMACCSAQDHSQAVIQYTVRNDS